MKAHVADVALVALDELPEMSALAKRFFLELSSKGNELYNLMPDIISRMSAAAVAGSRLANGVRMDTQTFNTLMQFLLAFIQKDKQGEHLLDKLAH